MKFALCCVVGWTLCTLAAVVFANPVPFAALARHPQYKMVKISPDGTHAAATVVLSDGQTALALLDLKTHKEIVRRVRGGDDVLHFWWVSPEYVVYSEAEHLGGLDTPVATGELYSIKADGSDATMLYGYRLHRQSTGTLLRVATPQRGSAQFLSTIDGDPHHILVAVTSWATVDAGARTQVYRMDIRDGTLRRVVGAPMREAHYLADHHGHVRFAFGPTLHGGWAVYMRPADGGDWSLLKQASAHRDEPLAFSSDDHTIWFDCAGGVRGFGICTFDPTTRKMAVVWANKDVEATGLAQGLAAGSVIGVRFTDGFPSTTLFSTQAPGARALVALMHRYPGENVRFVSGTPDGSEAVALVAADADPGRFVLYDRASNTFTLLAQRAKWINPRALGRSVPFTFTTRDGLTEQGYVTYPPGEVKARHLPMVVFVHGGPFGIRDWWRYDPYVQAMATRGYAVLQVNYRGSGGYGYAFMRAGWKQWGGKMQDDVTDATRAAIAQGIADPHRICIYGGSYGGYAALEGAEKFPNLYRCAIGYVGVYDLPMLYTRGDVPERLYGKAFLQRALGTDMKKLARHSPIHQLARLKAKVMLVVGGRDRRVPPVQGKDMHKAMLARGLKPVWMYKSNEAHGFYSVRDRAELFQRVDAFLAANIGPGVTKAVAASVGARH